MTSRDKKNRAAEFPKYLEHFTASNILSENAFSDVFTSRDAFDEQQRIRQHKEAALKRGISKRDYETALKAYKETHAKKLTADMPAWVTKNGIDERAFLDEFNSCRGFMCINGSLYTAGDGFIPDDVVAAEIQRELETAWTSQLRRKSLDLLGALKNRCHMEPPPAEPDRVYFKYGYYDLTDNSYHPQIGGFTFYRLAVEYQPNPEPPVKWISYLENLLPREDTMTLQEFCGYAMTPTTKAQKMLFLIGSGGEGKSVLGEVLAAAFGDSVEFGKLHDIQERFGLAQLEGKLLFIDDDLKTAALQDTDKLKTLVTLRTPMPIERKGKDIYQTQLYSRLLCFGNQIADSLYDKSDGFFRRRLILTTNGKPADRVDNPNLAEEIIKEELPGVAWWMLVGLKRLYKHNWQFTITERQKQLDAEFREASCNVIAFLRDTDRVKFDPAASATTRELYICYQHWCEDNGEEPLAQRTFSSRMKDMAKSLQIKPSQHVVGRDGLRARGFVGIGIENYIRLAG